jgi:isopentenyl diphosphate isomerase/L-lactate dehydrogenase-like FMN-dependent dehydrogenase
VYDAPFGVAPIGLQGLIWPGAPEVLARAAVDENLPFILSTCSTASIERIGEITGGDFWFQLYNPVDPAMRNDILDRAAAAGCRVLVILADVPTFGFRYHDVRNGLAIPPAINVRSVLEMVGSPAWAFQTLRHGQPTFATLTKYMPAGLDMKQLGLFMNRTFSGKLSPEMLASGAEFVFLGRGFMYGVAALGRAGGRHTMSILKTQLGQVLDQIGCDRIEDLPRHLVRHEGSASLSGPRAAHVTSASRESGHGNQSGGRS